MWHDHISQINIDYASWITAIATILAVIAASIASIKLYQLETKRDSETKRVAKLSQAIQISGWIDINPNIEPNNQNQHIPSLVAIVKNPSLQPIYNIQIIWYLKGEALSTDQAFLIRPKNGYHTFFMPVSHTNLLRAGGYTTNVSIFKNKLNYSDYETYFQSSNGEIDIGRSYPSEIAATVSETISTEFRLFFSFTDIEGVRWQRDIMGKLTQR